MIRIDVVFVRVEAGAATDPSMIGQLTPTELQQVERLGIAADRDRRATAHVAARRELACRLGTHPRHVPLAMSPTGQPIVEGMRVRVSWSHSGRWVAVAIAQDAAVGVDIERRPDEVPLRALRALGLASIEQFVAREAAGKATGEGLAGSWPADVAVEPLGAPAGYAAAVAAVGGPLSIRCNGIESMQVPSGRTRSIGVTRMAATNVWGYPDGVSWSGSRRHAPGSLTFSNFSNSMLHGLPSTIATLRT